MTQEVRAPLSPVDSQRPRPSSWSTTVWISGWWTCAGFRSGKTSSEPPRRTTTSVSVKTGVRRTPSVPVVTIPSSAWSALKFHTPVPTQPEANSKQAAVTSSAR